MTQALEFPAKLQPLFQPKRYKILYGGRGAGRSWGVARWLLLAGVERPIRVLCAREFQKSIEASVHKVLKDQIDLMGLSAHYLVEKAHIHGINGTEFSFEGIRQNVSKIKSYEGIDYCWVEEAESVTEASWNVLIPTIRKPDSEIIITFNPDLETDATYARFVKNPPPAEAAFCIKMTWRDNPYFPQILHDEMLLLRARDYDAYLHVWEGHPRQNLEGAVYADEMREATTQDRIRADVNYDRSTGVNLYFDIGRSDNTSIWFAQRVGFEDHLIDFYQTNRKHIDHYFGIVQNRGYLVNSIWLPHDAKAKELGSKLSIEEQARVKFPGMVFIVPKLSVQDGINAVRTVFPNCYFHSAKCEEGIQALRRYRYDITGLASDGKTKLYGSTPIHDEYSDAADAFRYFAVASKRASKRKRGLREPKVVDLDHGEWLDVSALSDSGAAWLGR